MPESSKLTANASKTTENNSSIDSNVLANQNRIRTLIQQQQQQKTRRKITHATSTHVLRSKLISCMLYDFVHG